MAKSKWTDEACGILAKMLGEPNRYTCQDVLAFIEGIDESFPEHSMWFESIWKCCTKRHSIELYRRLLDYEMPTRMCYSRLFGVLNELASERYLSESELESIAEYLRIVFVGARQNAEAGDESYSCDMKFFARYMPKRIDLIEQAADSGYAVFESEAWPAVIDQNEIALAELLAEKGCLPEGGVIVGGAVEIEMLEWLLEHGVEIDSVHLSCCKDVLSECDSRGIPPVEVGEFKPSDDTRLVDRWGASHLDEQALKDRLCANEEDFDFRIARGVLLGYRGDGEDVVVPSEVTVIASGFEGNTKVKSITVPEGVTEIGGPFRLPFAGCSDLERVLLPSTVDQIEWKAFDGCDSLASIDIDERCEKYFSIDGIPVRKGYGGCYEAFFPSKRYAGGTLAIPDGVENVSAFFQSSVSNVRKIEIPNSMTYSALWTDQNWACLEDIDVAENNNCYETIDGVLFHKGDKLVICPPSCSGERYEVPEGAKSIGPWAFRNCEALKEIILPKTVNSIERFAFSGIGSQVRLVLPSNLKKISGYEFDGITGYRGGSFDGFSGTVEYSGKSLPFDSKAFGRSLAPDLAIALPNIPIDKIPPALKTPAAIGYMDLYVRETPVPEKVAETYAKYIKSHRKDYYEAMCRDDRIASYLIGEALINLKELPDVIVLAKDAGAFELVARLEEFGKNPPKPKATVKQKTTKKPAGGEPEITVEPLVAEWFEKYKIDPKIKKGISKGVALADGKGTCSPEAFQLLVALCYVPQSVARDPFQEFEGLEYLEPDEFYNSQKTGYIKRNDSNEYVGSLFSKLTKPAGAGLTIAEISSWLDPDALSKALEHLFFKEDLGPALVALCRFGNEAAIKRVVNAMPKWKASKTERKDYYIAECALLHSRTREAMRYYDSEGNGWLYCYADMNGTTVDEIRDKLLSDFGFDSDGKMTIDLGA